MIRNNFKIEFIKFIKNRNDFYILLKKIKAKKICEIGIWKGDNLKNLLKHDVEEAYGIDSYCNNHLSNKGIEFSLKDLNEMYENVKKLEIKYKNLKIIRELSCKASSLFKDNYFDFIYIDADHSYEHIKEDLEIWYPKVKKGGILSGHDYVNHTLKNGVSFGVIKAVNEFSKKYNLDLFLTEESYPSWIFLKN